VMHVRARVYNLINRPGTVAGAAGFIIGAGLLSARAVASADLDSVTVAGHAFHWGCWLRQSFGVPCPFCGMTRAVLLTLHGQLQMAWQLNPAGPLLTVGLCLLAGALSLVMLCEQVRAGHDMALRLQRRLRFGATAYASLFLLTLTAHWLWALLWAH
jgi:Protein of unknown function (DUF2752)